MTVLIRLGLLATLLLLNTIGGMVSYPDQQSVAVPAPIASATAVATATATIPSNRLLISPLLAPSATAQASATASSTATSSPTMTPTATPYPNLSVASFALNESDVRHNIALALSANGGALQRVVIPPGATFSFNAALGPN